MYMLAIGQQLTMLLDNAETHIHLSSLLIQHWHTAQMIHGICTHFHDFPLISSSKLSSAGAVADCIASTLLGPECDMLLPRR